MTSISKIVDEADFILNNKNNTLLLLYPYLKSYSGSDIIDKELFRNDKYNRILIDTTKFVKVYLICWKSGQESSIHDHHNNGCIVKILKGSLMEELYSNNADGVQYYSQIVHKLNSILYRNGDTILHKIIPLEDTVSLHIYPINYYINSFST